MEQLEIPLDVIEQFALSDKPLMYSIGRYDDGTLVRLAPDDFEAPKWDLNTYSYETYTRERNHHTVTLRLDFVKRARQPWKPPARKAFEDPTGWKVGASVTFRLLGGERTGMVWAVAHRPTSVWVATDSGYYLVDTKSGAALEKWNGVL